MDGGARWRLAGLAVGAGLAFALTRTYLFDFAAPALALSLALGMLVGVAVTGRPPHPPGAASLRPRRVQEYVPAGAWIGTLALSAGLSAITTAYRMPERPDHEVKYFGVAAPVSLDSTRATLAVAVLLTALTIWVTVRSPRADDAWRRATVRLVANACAALFALVFTAVAFWYADDQLDWRAGGSPPWGFVLAGLGGLGLASLAHYGCVLATGGGDPSRPRGAADRDVDTATVDR